MRPRPSAPAVVAPPPARTVDVAAIVNAHLFGEANAPAAGSTDPNAVAASQMPLVLVGTIANTDPDARVRHHRRERGVGQGVRGRQDDYGRHQAPFGLPRPGDSRPGWQARGPAAAQEVPGRRHVARPRPRRAPARPTRCSGDRLRQLAATNPAAITDILRPQPVFANGQQRGYRIYPGRNRGQFNKLGLLPGDLVTAINGTPLDDASRGMDILQTMNTASAVTMTVERNGESVQVNVNNAQIAADAAAAAAQPEAIPVNEVPAEPGSSAE